MEERNSRTEMLIGKAALDKLKASRVAVFGVGGVGSYVTEALVRAGIGELDLFDGDVIAESNINRQLIADYSTLGMYKTDAAAERIGRINPECKVNRHAVFVTPELLSGFDLSPYSYIVDAIDTVSTKIALAQLAERADVPIISSMGTGNKLDPTAFEVTDIYKTSVCPLARVMRYELKRRGVQHLKVVYSREEPKRASLGTDSEGGEKDSTHRRIPPASISFVPSAAGLIIASEVIKDIIKTE